MSPLSLGCNNTVESAKKCSSIKNNKNQHTFNGNIKTKEVKNHKKPLQINKGHSNFSRLKKYY